MKRAISAAIALLFLASNHENSNVLANQMESFEGRDLAAAPKGKKSGGGGGGGGGGDDDGEGGGKGGDQTDDMPDKSSAADDSDDQAAKNAGVPEITDEELARQAASSDDKTQKDFSSRLDSSEDFSDDQFKAVAHKGPAYVLKIKRYGAIVELLEPRARQFVNVPQSRNPRKRKNCGHYADGKSHFLTMQGSKNFFQWRTKRKAKGGNCTVKVSMDGQQFFDVLPVGSKQKMFPCGRNTGYESKLLRLPKQVVSKNNELVVAQFEMYTWLGTIVQCADIIVQPSSNFAQGKCDPHCKNGGVCQNGKCRCGAMFYGDSCEYKGGASGAFSLLLFIFVIALVAAAIGLLYAKANLDKKNAANK